MDWRAGVVEGKRPGFLRENKNNCGTVRHFWPFPQRTHGLFLVEPVMMSQLYSTAENTPGSLAWRLKTRQLEAAREMGRCIGGIVIAAVFLITIGDAFGVLISNTDSAAPIGVYRVVSGEPKLGDLVAACLPIASSQQGLARGYLRTGACPGDAEPVGKIIGAVPGDTVQGERGWVSVDR